MSKSITLFFIRHAQRKDVSIKTDAPLTKKGIAQAKKTATLLSNLLPLKIFFSPTVKTSQTAEIIGSMLSVSAEETGILHESRKGSLDKCLALLDESSPPRVVFITHGSFIAEVLSSTFPKDYLNQFAPEVVKLGKYAIPEASITTLQKESGKWKLINSGSKYHL